MVGSKWSWYRCGMDGWDSVDWIRNVRLQLRTIDLREPEQIPCIFSYSCSLMKQKFV